MLFAGADTGLHDRLAAVRHGLDLDAPAFAAGRAVIAGKFRHGKAGMTVPVLLHALTGDDLTFDDVFGVGDGLLADGDAVGHLYSLAAHCSRDGKLVKAERRRGRLKAA